MKYTMDIMNSIEDIFSAILCGGSQEALNNKTFTKEQVLKKKEIHKICVSRFEAAFPVNIFQDEYALFYEVIKSLKIKFFTPNQITGIIDRNRDLVLDSPYIDMNRWAMTSDGKQATEDEKIIAFTQNVVDILKDLSTRIVEVDEFDSAIEIFKEYYIGQASLETAQNMTLILGESGLMIQSTNKRRKLYKGVEDANRYYDERQSIIRKLTAEEALDSTVVDDNWLEKDLAKDDKPDEEGILDTGLSVIDEVTGKFRRSNVITILGPTKGGKTRFTNHLVNRALSAGLNVCVWPQEGSKEEWIANQVACLIMNKQGIPYDSKRILERDYADDEMRKYCKAAKSEIALDTRRGRLSFMTGTAYVEDFIAELDNHYRKDNQFDVIVIDPLVNIQSRHGKQKVDRIGTAYTLLKDYISNKMEKKALALVPAQLKQDVIDSLRRNPGDTIDITAGGESSETIRSADEVIGLFSSKEERNLNQMKIYSVASRHSGNFPDFTAGCMLGCCYFKDRLDIK